MKTSDNNFLGEEPVGSLMKKYAIPCIISLLVGALYNIVDQVFIANASYLGSYGNAANTVVFPLTVIALAIAVMIGDGCHIRAGTVCSDPNGCSWDCYEVFPDSYFHCSGNGCRMYSCGRIQHGCRIKEPCTKAFYDTSCS